jgi:hypothetical protein
MEFLRKHYEKIILSVVLLGLGGAVGYLLWKIPTERELLEQKRIGIINVPVKPLPELNLSTNEAALQETRTPHKFILSGPPHNLCHPVTWVRSADGHLTKLPTGRELGPERVEVTKVTPLYLVINFDSVGLSGSNYLFKVENQVDPKKNHSRLLPGDREDDLFALKEVKGPPNKPEELVIELKDTKERVSVALGKPFRRPESYKVDLKYEPEKLTFRDKRVGASLNVGGEDFVIASINLIASNQYEVVLSAKQTGKKYTIKFNAVPQS